MYILDLQIDSTCSAGSSQEIKKEVLEVPGDCLRKPNFHMQPPNDLTDDLKKSEVLGVPGLKNRFYVVGLKIDSTPTRSRHILTECDFVCLSGMCSLFRRFFVCFCL